MLAKKVSKVCVISIILLIFSKSIFAQNFMSWGMPSSMAIPNWVSEIRIGCPSNPEYCINKINNYSPTSPKKISLAIGWKDAEYQELLLQIPMYTFYLKNQDRKVELSFDDFDGFLKKYSKSQIRNLLKILIFNKKSSNNPITIGLTVYEDQVEFIGATLFDEIYVRESIDRVALYLHHRGSIDSINKYIDKIKSIFPNAQIYLGVYHYDRSDYISCKFKSSERCTDKQELQLFEKTLIVQFNLLKLNRVHGLEFYPGNFNNEHAWTGWGNERICKQSRLANCINTSAAMGASVIDRLRDFSNGKLIK